MTPSDDSYEGSIPVRLEKAVLRELSHVNSIVSGAHVLLEWGLIVASALLCTRYFSYPLYVLTVVLIGARQHSLIVLMHDGAHYRLHRNRRINEVIGEALLAYPFLLFTMRDYRANHFAHHRHLNTNKDPDWVRKQTPDWKFPKSPFAMAKLLAQNALGFGFMRFLLATLALPKSRLDQRSYLRIGYIALACAVITLTGAWVTVALYWLVPLATWAQFAFHVRSIAEHFALPEREGVYGETRTVLANAFDRVFVGCKNVNYHLEHHLFPSVPFFRLGRLHAILMSRDDYRRQAHVTRGYWRVMVECTRGAPDQAREPLRQAAGGG